MKTKENLLQKYYNGETSLEEEETLKKRIISEDNPLSENDIFGFYRDAGNVPRGLEEEIMNEIKKQELKKKSRRLWIYRISSAAAVLLIAFSIFFGYKTRKNARIEHNFLVMEQALYKVSESIQPEEEQEMLVLWVDENVEIIINE